MNFEQLSQDPQAVGAATTLLLQTGYLSDGGDCYKCSPKGGALLQRVLSVKSQTPEEKAMLIFALAHELITTVPTIN